MNHPYPSPMLGDTSSLREVAGGYEMGVLDIDDLIPNSFAPLGSENISTAVLASAIELHSSGINIYKPVGDCDFMTAPQPEGRVHRANSFDDLETIIKRESSREQNHEFRIVAHGKTHEMKGSLLIAMPDKDIPFEVKGAQGGYVVEVGMRYTTGVHHDTPVLACKTHSDNVNAGFSFHVPKLHVEKMTDQGHPTIKIPVPCTASDEPFTFSVVFWCLNSCHRKYGKGQEVILKLWNAQGTLVKETRIELRICRNVNRDKNLEGQSPRQGKKKRSSGGKVKGAALKKLKQEVPEGSGGVQAGAADTPAPLQFLSPRQANLQIRCDPALLSNMREFVKLMSQFGWIEMKELMDGASPDPPPIME